jgi:DNA-binding MarR family transcriptional regulator
MAQDVLLSLRQIIHAMNLRSRQLAKSVGLTVPQLIVLREIGEIREGAPIGQIAKRISLSQATVTTIVDRLEQRDAVRRQRAESDRRKVYVQITESGRALLDKSPPILQEQFIDAFDQIEPWEQTLILSTLQRVAAMMDAQAIPVPPILAVEPLPDGTTETESLDQSDIAGLPTSL